MRRRRIQPGLTLLEMLTALAIVLLLAGLLAGLGQRLRRQSEANLTESILSVLTLALEQYYEVQVSVPRYYPPDNRLDWEFIVGPTAIQPAASHSNTFWSSESLHYFLDLEPRSARILDTLADQARTNLGTNEVPMRIEMPAGSNNFVDLVRFIDAWGNVIGYEYDPASGSFPLLRSAGPDEQFGTEDDMTSR